MNRRHFVLAALGAASAAAGCSRFKSKSPLQQAVDYLWAQQADDGGFHSSTYGLLRSGQSLTPFVLDALLEVPAAVAPPRPAAVDRALDFIRNHTNAEGALGLMDETADDYPNYATALAISVIAKAKRGDVQQAIPKMVAQLRAQQFCEANGWLPGHVPYGAWGMGGPIHRPPDTGHVDLSMTRYVLEALRAAGIPAADPAVTHALVYLQRSQNADGGFYYSTVNPDVNKAGENNGQFISYGTATADGLLALRAAGLPDSDSRAAGAIRWLREHHRPDHAPGFEGTAREPWGHGLRFYYAGAISKALPDLPIRLPEMASDHSFRNSNTMVKEDDPLIATTFALQVLVRRLP